MATPVLLHFCKGHRIAKQRNTFAKRQREQEKRQRANDKRLKREQKLVSHANRSPEVTTASVMPPGPDPLGGLDD